MATPENFKAVKALKKVLEGLILGRRLPQFFVNLGGENIKMGPAEAVSIIVSEDGFWPDYEKKWYLWSVAMSANPRKGDCDFTIGLSAFLLGEMLDYLFKYVFDSGDDMEKNIETMNNWADLTFKREE